MSETDPLPETAFMQMRFDDRVAIVTGAGGGLGRAHAQGLAERGCKVIVNDVFEESALSVAIEIAANGGKAVHVAGDISDPETSAKLVKKAQDKWGRLDIVVNNAGILRDKSFAKMDMGDFRQVMDVHLMGAAQLTQAAWPMMREAKYGRVVFTSSGSGLYGNFGQSNYGAAKSGMLGLMNVLHLEGARDNIRVNMLAPTAATQMTHALFPPNTHSLLSPESITPGLIYLVSENAPSQVILSAGAGCFSVTKVLESEGVALEDDDITPENIAARFAEISDMDGAHAIPDAFSQTQRFAKKPPPCAAKI